VTQNKFRFLLLSNWVAIGFTDKEGKPKQFTKSTNTDDLDFLTKEWKIKADEGHCPQSSSPPH
jgi:hypothetical protein